MISGYDISGFLTTPDGKDTPSAYVPVCDHGITRIGKIVRYGRWWAVKSLSPGCPDEFLGKSLLEKEFQILISLSHPHILRATELTEIPPLGLCMVTEFVEGCDLATWLGRKPSRKRRRRLARQIVSTFAYLHGKGLTHRDIKPENMMVDGDDNLKVIDFGLGDGADFAYIKHVTGTPLYAAPELASDNAADPFRTDVYSIGKVLSLIFPGRRWRRVIRKAVSPDPARRPADAAALSRMLQRSKTGRTGIGALCIMLSLAALTALVYYPGVETEIAAPGHPPVEADTAQSAEKRPEQTDPVSPSQGHEAGTHTPYVREIGKSADVAVRKPDPEPAAPSTPRVSPTQSLIAALMKASDAWYAEKSKAQEEHRGFDFGNVRRVADGLRRKGIENAGWGPEEVSQFDIIIASESFRDGGQIAPLPFVAGAAAPEKVR